MPLNNLSSSYRQPTVHVLFTSFEARKANNPNTRPDATPITGPTINIASRGSAIGIILLIWASSSGWFARYVVENNTWAPVIHTQLSMLTMNPWRKYFPEHFREMTYAQKRKTASQNTGSMLEGIQNTVAIAIANPNRES